MAHSVCWCCIFWRKMPKLRYWVIFIASSILALPAAGGSDGANGPAERKAMGLQAALAGLPLPACEQMVPPREDFTSWTRDRPGALLQGAGFAAAHRFFRRWGFTAGWRSGSEPLAGWR